MVLITPFGSTSRTTLLTVSAINRLPSTSTATACGVKNCADVAGPPSPE